MPISDEQLIVIFSDLATIKQSGLASVDRMDDLCHYLKGNGQPGAIQRLQERDNELQQHIDRIEVEMSRWAGIAIGVSIACSVVLTLVEHYSKWFR